MRFNADTGETNTGLFKEVKVNRGRPMAMVSPEDLQGNKTGYALMMHAFGQTLKLAEHVGVYPLTSASSKANCLCTFRSPPSERSWLRPNSPPRVSKETAPAWRQIHWGRSDRTAGDHRFGMMIVIPNR
jgi:hypothetical protein